MFCSLIKRCAMIEMISGGFVTAVLSHQTRLEPIRHNTSCRSKNPLKRRFFLVSIKALD